MESIPDASHLPLFLLILVAITLGSGQLAERRRGDSADWSNIALVFLGITIGIVLMFFYVVAVFVVLGLSVAYLLWKVTFRSLADMDGLVQAETVLQLAALFSIAANFADVASTFGRVGFWRHTRQFVAFVPAAYYAAIGTTWLLALILVLRGNVNDYGAPQVWRLLKLPVLAPHAGLNTLLVTIVVIATAVTSYLLRKRGDER